MSGGRVWRRICLALAGVLWIFSASAVLPGGTREDLIPLGFGFSLGCLLVGCQRHPGRLFAAVPCGCAVLTVTLICTALAPGFWSTFLLGVAAGLLTVPLVAAARKRNWWTVVAFVGWFTLPTIFTLRGLGIPGTTSAALWIFSLLAGA